MRVAGLSQIALRLKRLLSSEDYSQVEEASSQAADEEARISSPYDDRTFNLVTTELVKLVKRGGPDMAARIMRFDLGPIRAEFGTDWPAHARRIREGCQTTLRRSLGDGALIISHGPEVFLIVAPGLSPDAAWLALRRAAADATRFVFGDGAIAPAPELSHLSQTTDGSLTFRPLPSADPADDPQPADNAPPGISEAPRPRIAMRWWTTTADRAVPDFDVFEIPDLPALKPVVRYLPVVALRSSTIAAGLLRIEHTDPLGTMTDHGLLGPNPPAQLVAEYDHRLLSRAARDLALRLHQAMSTIVVAPLHFDTVAAAGRRSLYAAHLRQLPAAVQRALMIKIINCPSDVSPGLLSEITLALRTGARGVIAAIPVNTIDVQRFADAGVAGICQSFDPRPAETALAAMAARIQRARLTLQVSDVTDGNRLDEARRIKAHTVCGEAVGRGDAIPPSLGIPHHLPEPGLSHTIRTA